MNTTRRTSPFLRRALVLALAGALVGGPALAQDLDDIRDAIDKVEQQQSRAREAAGSSKDKAAGLSDELAATTQDLSAADQRLRDTEKKVATARATLQEAESDLADAEAEAQRIETELAGARADEKRLESSLAANEEQQEESRRTVGAIARESYKQGGMGTLATALELVSGGNDAVEEMAMTRTVLRVQDQEIRRLSEKQAEGVAEADRLAGVRQDIAYLLARAEAVVVEKDQARGAAEAAKTELEALEAQQEKDRAALEKEKAKVADQLAAEEARGQDLEAQLAELASTKHGLKTEERAELTRIAREEARRKAAEEARRKAAEEAARQKAAEEAARQQAAQREAERQRAAAAEAQRQRDAAAQAEAERRAAAAQAEADAAAAAARQAAADEAAQQAAAQAAEQEAAEQAAAQQGSGSLAHPVNGPITSEFGMRLHPVLGYYRMHNGIDYGVGCGTPVRAAAAGTVFQRAYDAGMGHYVVIDHGVMRGVNLATAYLHFQSTAIVAPGTRVAAGQVIGYVGTTGTSTGCHLHFETRENGTPVNPRTWL